MSLAIAIVALLVAAYALYSSRKVLAALAEFADMVPDDEDEPESGELWLSDGEFYCADRDALSAALPGVLGFVTIEGVPSAVMPNGVWSLHKLLSEGGKPGKATVRDDHVTDEFDRERLARVSDKALTQIAQATAALDVQFVAILRTATELRVYCSDEADIRELFEGALPSIEEVPEGATLN